MRGGGVDSGDVVGGEMGLYSMKSLIFSSRSSSIPKSKPRSIIGDGGRESSLEVGRWGQRAKANVTGEEDQERCVDDSPYSVKGCTLAPVTERL